MKLIPVIDLKGGLVVAARGGDRHAYAPIQSPLCPSAEPLPVAAAILKLYPFDTLYIADLDAIGGGPGQLELIEQIHRAHPGVELWADNGLTQLQRLAAVARPVIGSESLADLEHWAVLRSALSAPILSLDYRGHQPMGPTELHERPELWPREVILMTLGRVGSEAGPDLERLTALRQSAPTHRLYAAGGVRGPADLRQLRDLGVVGALVSTALHRGRFTPDVLDDLANAKQSLEIQIFGINSRSDDPPMGP